MPVDGVDTDTDVDVDADGAALGATVSPKAGAALGGCKGFTHVVS